MNKSILLCIILCLCSCKSLNDSQENNEIKKCRNALLYNLFLSQELAKGTSRKIEEQALIFNYTQCLEIAKLKRGKIEIPL
ncbi:MAG: hypothetical protein IPL26_10110 [Leptospiraceae bacterium]|nr:hypothetical protein [Leptospiraceae bacterium]